MWNLLLVVVCINSVQYSVNLYTGGLASVSGAIYEDDSPFDNYTYEHTHTVHVTICLLYIKMGSCKICIY